ncbi:hypothetical protein RSAG8_09012, partial [Rhizoctonia solani AG-8 WAC10335]
MQTLLHNPDLHLAENPPTHVAGLVTVPEESFSLLVWGTCELVDHTTLKIKLTMYDSQAKLQTQDALSPYLKQVGQILEASLTPTFEMDKELVLVQPNWSNELQELPEDELTAVFCQLISCVVHELPFDRHTLQLGPPLGSHWPVHVTHRQVAALLGQVVNKQLSVLRIKDKAASIPECIYIHGDSFIWDDFGASQTLDEPIEHEKSPKLPAEEEMDNSGEGDSQGEVEVEDMGDMTWYIKTTAPTQYCPNTPTDFSTSDTPPRIITTLVNKDTAQHQRQLVESTQALLQQLPTVSHTHRLSYWEQLRQSQPTVDCISLLTLHLWLSALLAEPSRNVLYLDPQLCDELVANYQRNTSMVPEDIHGLLDRHLLWPQMGNDFRIAILGYPGDNSDTGIDSWFLMSIMAERDGSLLLDVLLPPSQAYNQELFATYVGSLIGALNCTLKPPLVEHSAQVKQTLRAVVIPQPHTSETIFLVMFTYLCCLLLGQTVPSVDISAVRQSLCYYYDHALRTREIDASFPWVALTNAEGVLQTEKCSDTVQRRRYKLATNREPSPFERFPRTRSYTATLATPGPSAAFFLELTQPKTSHPEGMLVGTSGRSVEHLEKAVFLGPHPSWPQRFPDRLLQVPEAYSLDEFTHLLHSLGGPESRDGQILLLTMKHENKRIKLNWLKDATFPEKEQLMASFDVDSLTLTVQDAPELLEAGTFWPYPNRSLSLTYRNELSVMFDEKKIDMHTCPNFCVMSLGSNNQFRLLVFLPNCRERLGNLWRNLPYEHEMSGWYHTFLTALQIISELVPVEWQHAVEKTIEALPTTYEMAQNQATKGGGPRSFAGYRIEPQIMNHVFKVMRQIVDSTPSLEMYRGSFFHVCGINLKLANSNILGREDKNPLDFVFRNNMFLDWYSQNPNDIVADIAVTANILRRAVPQALKRGTLLMRYSPLREMVRPAYKTPIQDSYCHSEVIAGLHAIPLAAFIREAAIMKLQAYFKDMVLTYRSRESSVGTNFNVDQAIGLKPRGPFLSQMKAFQEIMEVAGTYGLRFEWRLSAWGANQLMQKDAREIVDRLVDAEVIACHPTETVAGFKLALSRGWVAVIERQAQLPRIARKSPEVVLLTSVLAYWLKGLVKRPDVMGFTIDMTHRLNLVENARICGLPFLRSNTLDPEGLQMSYLVDAASFKIMANANVTLPNGHRIQNASTTRETQRAAALQSPPATPQGPALDNSSWSDSSEQFLKLLLKQHFPQALWSFFPDANKTKGEVADKLRQGPLKRRSWDKMVEPLVTYNLLRGKYMDSFEKLFPQNWSCEKAQGDWLRYNRNFLQRIRDHVNSKPAESRTAYSAVLRRKIRTSIMEQWDFLPAVQAYKIWPFTAGVDRVRIYRIYSRSV